MDQMPKAISQNWKQLASVQVGGAICLPLLLVGYELAKGGNLKNQLFSVFIGNALLFTFALVAGFMSANRKLTTVEHASIYFGEKAKKFFALTMSFSMLGWFAIQTQCMGGDVYHLMQQLKVGPHFQGEFWRTTFCFILAILMLGGAFLGLRFLTWLSNVCVPLLIATIGYAVYQVGALSFEQSSDLQSFHVWDGKGISLVLASSIAATIDLPTFYRHARSRKESTGASIANYLIAMPLVQIAGMWLYYGTKETTITQALAAHPSFSWKVWVVCFMLLAGWTTNNVNLYSAALSLKSLFSGLSFSKLMAMAGLGGCLLVFIPLLDQFAQSLDLIGIFVASMGLVMFMAYILESGSMHANSLSIWLAWSIGIGSGLFAKFLPAWGTGAPVLDAAMAAGLALPLIHFFSSNGLFNCLKATTFKEEIR